MKSSLVVLQYKYIPASIVVQAGIQIIYNAVCSFCQPFLLSVDCMFISTGVTICFYWLYIYGVSYDMCYIKR